MRQLFLYILLSFVLLASSLPLQAASSSFDQDENLEEERLQLIEEDLPPSDIPITLNERVEYFIQYFTTTKRKVFERWLELAGRYRPMIQEILREYGLPEDLVYLAMIESGFNPFAYSRAGACGIWQFIRSTARKYGLKIDYWVDERRDPEKATRAAAKYLLELYNEFDCWHLASASYNAGEAKLRTAIKRYGTKDFWKLCRYRYLKKETKNYVPKMIAAMIIAKNPEKFGFFVEPLPPLYYETIDVPGGTDLRAVALATGVDYDLIRLLNAELRRGKTPPYAVTYPVKVPFGYGAKGLEALKKIRFVYTRQILRHRVSRGETLYEIASYYGTTVRALKRANRIRGRRLRPGKVLRIPVKTQAFLYVAANPSEAKSIVIKTAAKPKPKPKVKIYWVKPGDSLWEIARKFGVSPRDLKAWNNLRSNVIRPGLKLVILPEA